MHQFVHEASLQDHDGGKDLLSPLRERLPRLKLIWADSGYKKGGFVEWVKATLGWEVEIVEHPWSGLRGVWAPNELLPSSEEAWIYLAMIRIMLRRLAQNRS